MSEGGQEGCDGVTAGDVMALETGVAPFVMIVEGPEAGGPIDPKYGRRIYFRWLAHMDSSKESLRDWIWESMLSNAAWVKIA
jgi:hypothetical protein